MRKPFLTEKVEPAFRWGETPNPNAYSPSTRHVWTHGPRGPVPIHRPAPKAAPPAPAPPARTDGSFQISERVLEWPATGDRYEGDLDGSGVMHGEGRLTYGNGECYQGQFRRGKRTGKGAYHHSSGVVTVSEWLNDRVVGVSLRWSADRRNAWALVEGAVEFENARVAPIDSLTHVHGLRWNQEKHGAISLTQAYTLCCQAGLQEIASAVGAPRFELRTEGAFEPTTQTIWAKPRNFVDGRPLRGVQPVAFAKCPPTHRPSPAMRQAAYRDPANRATYRPAPPPDVWPWPLSRPVHTSDGKRFEVEKSIFERRGDTANALAARAEMSRLPEGAAAGEREALYDSIYAKMRKEGVAPLHKAASTNADLPPPDGPPPVYAQPLPWVTPGASLMAPTPAVTPA